MFLRVVRFTADEGKEVSWSSWWMGSSCVMIVQDRLGIDESVLLSEINSERWFLDQKGRKRGE